MILCQSGLCFPTFDSVVSFISFIGFYGFDFSPAGCSKLFSFLILKYKFCQFPQTLLLRKRHALVLTLNTHYISDQRVAVIDELLDFSLVMCVGKEALFWDM